MRLGKHGKEKGEKKTARAAAAVLILLALAAGSMTLISGRISQRREEVLEAVRLAEEERRREKELAEEEEEKAAREQREAVYEFGLESGANVFEAVRNRPPSVELDGENTPDFVSIDSCRIDTKTNKISVSASAEGLPVSDDKFYYLFSVKPYAEDIPEDKEPLKRCYKGEQMVFHVPRYFAGTESAVLNKFVVAVKKDNVYVPVSPSHYVTNQGETSRYKAGGNQKSSKKGLLVDPNKLRTSELDDLGVKHAAYNIPVSRILGPSTEKAMRLTDKFCRNMIWYSAY